MTSGKNISASVRQRLLNRAHHDDRPFNELLQYYAMERFLYRLSRSAHAERFILKGALMLRVWRSPQFRPTMDIDMLGKTSREEALILRQIQEIMKVDVGVDGLLFDPDSLRTERITEDAEYEGIRVRFLGSLGTARINMQIDIGFGDIIHPRPEMAEMPTLLDSPAPRLLCYSRESAIAEKFEAMVSLGTLNSRMKDFYDIWLLSRQFDFNGKDLAEAIRLTFKQRGTVLPEQIEAFSRDFAEVKQTQWAAFRKRLQQEHVPVSFQEVTRALEIFLVPITTSISEESGTPKIWPVSGPWS
ncbi:MAG: nucleotidyl transferase AbiEii/AbiGii toxin family protein [Desulfomicrobium sp.]|nr:nucleotidyl transferase AbiEii/AbiGii toxin family protein [Desulfomicrobium sp.]